MWKNTVNRHGSVSIGLHRLMPTGVFACIELRELFPEGSNPREALKAWYSMLGLSAFVLVWLRLAMHFSGPTPRIEPVPPAWQRLSATLVHAGLCALMIGLPSGGWVPLSASGTPIPFFGLQLPALMGENQGLADPIREIHETGGTVDIFASDFMPQPHCSTTASGETTHLTNLIQHFLRGHRCPSRAV